MRATLETSESIEHASNLAGGRTCEMNSLTVAGQYRIFTSFPHQATKSALTLA
jgi:hypothetical protein